MLTRASIVVRSSSASTARSFATDAKAAAAGAPVHRPKAVPHKYRGVKNLTLAERAALQKRELDRLRTTEVPWPGKHQIHYHYHFYYLFCCL